MQFHLTKNVAARSQGSLLSPIMNFDFFFSLFFPLSLSVHRIHPPIFSVHLIHPPSRGLELKGWGIVPPQSNHFSSHFCCAVRWVTHLSAPSVLLRHQERLKLTLVATRTSLIISKPVLTTLSNEIWGLTKSHMFKINTPNYCATNRSGGAAVLIL